MVKFSVEIAAAKRPQPLWVDRESEADLQTVVLRISSLTKSTYRELQAVEGAIAIVLRRTVRTGLTVPVRGAIAIPRTQL
ncbi:hypothetical protein [Baaleninema sp.]|uniref:hypothetical protein n=1 Tax=Baaleninema sp. TaxID=3101197 RepID=UPI003D05018F